MRKIFGYIEKIEFPYLVGMFFLATMVYGLLVNTLLQKFGINDPLAFRYIWPVYFLLLPFPIKLYTEIRKIKTFQLFPFLLLIIAILNPIVAAAGALRLNNTNDNSVTITSIGLVILLFILTFWKKKLSSLSHVISIYSAALSLIFSNALRSNYLIGWDIHQEFLVFRLTASHNRWDMSFFHDAYNACLSITILPTIIRNLTGLDSLTIFKTIFPFFLAVIPIVIYWISSRITSRNLAYASTFAFLLQSQFFNQLPALLRQGIGFLFFSLLIDLLVRSDLKMGNKKFIFFIFSFGMVISHYSTTYMAIGILFLAKVVLFTLKLLTKNKHKTVLTFPLLLTLLVYTFFWNTLITNTTSGLSNTFRQIWENIDQSFTLENKSTMVKDVLYIKTNNSDLVQNYTSDKMSSVEKPSYYDGYLVQPVTIDHPVLTKQTKIISDYFHVFIPWLFRGLIIIGFICIFWKSIRRKTALETASISAGMLVIIAASIIVPYISVNYNLERILQQMFTLLSPICIIGIAATIRRLKIIPTALVIIIILTSYILQSTGLIDNLVVQSKSIALDNQGEQYLQYYSDASEIQSIYWMDKNVSETAVINMDRYSQLRLKAYSSIIHNFDKYVRQDLIPPVIFDESYTLAGNAAIKSNVVFTVYKNQIIKYTFPFRYMEDKRNLVYSTGDSRIYK